MARRITIPRFFHRLRNLRNRVETNLNYRLGREFIPERDGLLYVESTSSCNLRCRFCAYVKKSSPRVTMSLDFFKDTIEQTLDLGYDKYELTPCTGDVFMDKGIFDKLEFLEANPRVKAFEFFTNLTIPTPESVVRLSGFAKLRSLFVSIYGHDLETFREVARSTEVVYERLLANLEALFNARDLFNGRLWMGQRSTNRIPKGDASRLQTWLNRFRQAGIEVRVSRLYNNWGGMVTQADMGDLDIDIVGDDAIYKKGACSRLFTHVQILSTGIVNGCACRDVDATLRIGDLNEKPLREILSADNPLYRAVVDEQQRGEYRPICRSCDFYKSICRLRMSDRRRGGQSLPEFWETLGRP